MEDVLVKATADGVRIYALCTTNLVREAAKKHGCSHLASAALGRAMNGALLLAATMKDNERITLRLKGDGPLGEVVADAEGNCVRGYVENPDAFLPLKNGKLDVGGGISAGNIMSPSRRRRALLWAYWWTKKAKLLRLAVSLFRRCLAVQTKCWRSWKIT